MFDVHCFVYTIYEYIRSVGIGIVYPRLEGNAKALVNGIGNSFDSRAFSLCMVEFDNVSL